LKKCLKENELEDILISKKEDYILNKE